MLMKALQAALISLAVAAPALASNTPAPPSQGGQAAQKAPDVLVIKAKADQNGQPMTSEAQAIPLTNVPIPRDSHGAVDQQALQQAAQQAMQQQQDSILLKPNGDDASVPDAVKQEFQKAAQQQGSQEMLYWTWYYPYYNYGLYGYGYYPYWGYYNNYYPYYGYYYSGYTYPYYYGFYNYYYPYYYYYYYHY